MMTANAMLPSRWEYRIVTHQQYGLDDPKNARDQRQVHLDELNALGSEGWELVAAVPVADIDGLVEVRYVFKRILE
jgi:hypothetical protein